MLAQGRMLEWLEVSLPVRRPMKRSLKHLFACSGVAILLLFLTVAPSWGQKGGGGSTGSRPSGSTGSTTTSVPGQQPLGQSPQMQTPLYVNGRVLLNDTGQPAPEPVSVQLNCGMNLLQAIQTDLKGYFQFVLGAGPQGNANLSAADQTPMSMPGMGGGGYQSPMGGYGGFGNLTGCELRVSVDGYLPATHILSGPPELTTMEVGTLRLTRIAGVQGSAISVTSMLVPGKARKEFEQGDKDARSNKFKSASEHLQKAVEEYEAYAAAWNELGSVYVATHEPDKAREAFEKAMTADPKYIPPYVNLANLQLQAQEYENAVGTAGKALDLNPSIPVANYVQAVGNFKLNRLDDAEKSAQEVEKGPHQNLPQVYALLTDIFLMKNDYPHAAAQMRAYLKAWPKGAFAPEMKKRLDQIEASGAAPSGAAAESKSSAAQPQAAP
jgi:tetratricopeptide (TPR) repeat protein